MLSTTTILKKRKVKKSITSTGIVALNYYRQRWWSRYRARDSEREEEEDARDRRKEADDLEFAAAQERESAERAAARERARLKAEEEAQRAREEAAKANIVEQVEIAQPEGFVVDRIMTKEERTAAIYQIMSTIPSDKEELFQWEIKWEHVDDVKEV